MTMYWVSFRISDTGDHQSVYHKLNETVSASALNAKWWIEPTSFFAFQSDLTSNQLVAELEAAIRPSVDLVVLGSFDKKVCRVIGKNDDDDIYDLVDFAKRG